MSFWSVFQILDSIVVILRSVFDILELRGVIVQCVVHILDFGSVHVHVHSDLTADPLEMRMK